MIDIILIAIIGIITWCVASEGAWGAVLTFFSVILAGLLAMNYFEPVAQLLGGSITNSGAWKYRWDFIALMGIFGIGIFAFRTITDYLAPNYQEVHSLMHDGFRWGFGFFTGYVTMAICCTALHTAALPREFLGFTPERNNLLGIAAPDRQWLGFTQYVTEKNFSSGRIFDGPQYAVVEGQEPEIWPSFPIRYATTRMQASGAMAASQQQPQFSEQAPSGAKRRGGAAAF